MSNFDEEGEDEVRRKLSAGPYSSARQLHDAAEWLGRKSAERKSQVNEDRHLTERQTVAAETSNQLSERQAQAAESANTLAKEANTLSKWALALSVLGCILAVAAILYDHA